MDRDQNFINLIRENTSSILRICSVYADEVYRAEDLFQEVILNIWKSQDSFREESRWKTWIYRIAINVCLSIHRKQNKKKVLPLNDLIYSESVETDTQDHATLLFCIKGLHEADRSVVTLYLEGLDYKNIGEILGIKENTVAVKMKRIKNKLLKCFNHEG